MAGILFYVIDTETNGLDSNRHEVNEISIIRCSDRMQLMEFIKCDHPERSSYDALIATNKTIEDLEQGKSKEEVIDKVDSFFNKDGLRPENRCFIAHNAKFDRKFIHALYDKVDKKCPVNLWLCTMELTKQYIKQMGIKSRVNLHTACDVVGIKKYSEAHSAKVDTRNTYLLYKSLVEDKKIDYLPFIKIFPHVLDLCESELDPDLI